MKKMLDGIRVLDLTNVLSGPFATLHLALLGADVIKIENPQEGDLARKLGCVKEYNSNLMGTSFLAQNANKRSLTLNLKHEQGKEIFKKLLMISDVVVENFRPGVMERLGLSYDELKVLKPDIIYLAISGFGQTGPDSKKPAYDQIIQGLSGEMAINGTIDFNPLRAGFPVCDTVGGLNGAFALMSALYHKERTGEGQFIDVALLDSIMPLMGWVVANLMIGGQEPQLMGNDNFTAAPSGVFNTKDGYINIAANKQEQWEAVADITGLSELKEDIRFKERDARKTNRLELTPLLEEKLIKQTTNYWVEKFNSVGVPSGAIMKLGDALNQDQIKHRGTFQTTIVDGIGEIELFNMTAKFSKTPGLVESPPPKLSQHTEQILDLIGMKDKIHELKKLNII